jgi:hypothetical protein
LFPLDEDQRRALVLMEFGGDQGQAEKFLDLIDRIPNLPDLAANPRMLGFMTAWLGEGEDKVTEEELWQAAERSGAMTAGALYRLLIHKWLAHEEVRNPVLSAEQRLEAITSIALFSWRGGEPSVTLDDLEVLATQIRDLDHQVLRPREAAQAIGSGTLLVRCGEDEFGFLHASVMEWLVANHLAGELKARGLAGADAGLADRLLTSLMVDFLCDLAGAEPVIAWARETVTAAESPAWPQSRMPS